VAQRASILHLLTTVHVSLQGKECLALGRLALGGSGKPFLLRSCDQARLGA
jgi:hypothetical protein